MVCFVTDQCSKPREFIKNHYEWPPNCTSNEGACEYLVEWELKEGDRYVKFTIWSRRGEEDNWIGIHFKHQNVSKKSQLDSITYTQNHENIFTREAGTLWWESSLRWETLQLFWTHCLMKGTYHNRHYFLALKAEEVFHFKPQSTTVWLARVYNLLTSRDENVFAVLAASR